MDKPSKNSVCQVIDPKSGSFSMQIEDKQTDQVNFSDKELQYLLDNKLVPSELTEVGLKQIKRLKVEIEERQEFIKNNPNPTIEEELEWFKSRERPTAEDLKKSSELLQYLISNHDKLKQSLEVFSNPKTFAFPSHYIMFSLLAMFAGKTERLPRELLEKPYLERTPEEQKKADDYLSSIFETKTIIDYSDGKENISEKRIALICDNPKVEGKAEINWNLFRGDISFREEMLALYIKRTFGPEGIRHLLSLIIGLEENSRKGHFVWSVNEHLERLGYKRKANGSFDPELKKMASEIIKIFTGLCITSTRKDGNKGSIQAKYLFMVEGFEIKTFEKEIIDEKITLVATDFWYKNAFYPEDNKAPQYTKLLKEIVKENHKTNSLTLYLVPLLTIFWRISPERKFKVRNLMEWCDLKFEGKYKSENLKDLECALDYMKEKNYLGDWICDGTDKYPSKCNKPYDRVLTFTPPVWLEHEFILLQKRKEVPQLTEKNILSVNEFVEIFKASGLSQRGFAKALGVTSALISSIINGKRGITEETAEKVKKFKANL